MNPPGPEATQSALRVLLKHLEERREAGETKVSLTADARLSLRTLMLRARNPGAAAPPPRTQATAPQPAAPVVAPAPAHVPAPAPVAEPVVPPPAQPAPAAEAQPPQESPAPAPEPPPVAPPPASEIRNPQPAIPLSTPLSPVRLSLEQRLTRLAVVKADAANCPRCAALGTLRQTMVFATGNPESPLMFVGEAPGEEEEKQLEPFVGPAGQLLSKIIKAMGLTRQEVYISNIVKYRPLIPGFQGSKNRQPTTEEMAASIEYLRREIEIIQPRVIVALGSTAMEGLLGVVTSVSKSRGQWHEFQGIPTMVTYHPSYLLRSNPGELTSRRMVWEDMMLVMERLGMPIAENQRTFFLVKK